MGDETANAYTVAETRTNQFADELKISIRVEGELIQVGRRYRGDDGNLLVDWALPASEIEHKIFFLHD
ncbi:hypothetical protein [uncultured Aliiroseovarius sp.]|uniref:hypothetical protein n=1 Tax=uncultured Aliiroseovarius sp. TaxID=1658783 RepID=UPI00261A0E28|nr:hypothetical protein [uncultured Aliiroseovarius sp.]